ncbi:hypothetical protein DFH07DRAFT_567841 [Mycena maculata]|uniref:F-box domain-containing protein n=1 Tax=Mycena maculata TaxID=230809 RepID=A0AAD7K3Y1_9AGAR|nr:hypothetical protein DFH07DRAFT_567841 [Mycena maculata]
MASDRPWIQSLRADSSSPPRCRNDSDSDKQVVEGSRRLSPSCDASSVKRRAFASIRADGRRALNPKRKSTDAAVAPPSPKSSANKCPDTVVEPAAKCPNLCCDYLSGSLFQSHPRIMNKLRMNYFLAPQQAIRATDQISRAEVQAVSYEKEIIRLKRLLAACPPPDHQARIAPVSSKVASKACIHACCDSSTLPPRASTEMLRLRHVVQILQLKRREILQYLRAKRSMLSPIRRLPLELLQMVFSFAVQPNTRDVSPLIALAAIRLSQVCIYWRTVVVDTRKLWTTIFLGRKLSRPKSNIAHLIFYAAKAKALPLTIRCIRWPSQRLMSKLTGMSPRWYDINLTITDDIFEEFDVVRARIPLLRSLCVHNTSERDGSQTSDAFADAPCLRRVVLTAGASYIWPFSFILPWAQVTSLTLNPISMSVFSECVRNCHRLLYFNATISPRPAEAVPQMAELRSPLRKLVLHGWGCQDVVAGHCFPHMVSLSIDMNRLLHPEFLPFLVQASHLEMLAVSGWQCTTADLVALLLATPSLRILHFRDLLRALVTPRFYTPLITRAADEAFVPVEPQSLAELHIEKYYSVPDGALLGMMRARTILSPFIDPQEIELARVDAIPNIIHTDIIRSVVPCLSDSAPSTVPFDPEAELDHLFMP